MWTENAVHFRKGIIYKGGWEDITRPAPNSKRSLRWHKRNILTRFSYYKESDDKGTKIHEQNRLFVNRLYMNLWNKILLIIFFPTISSSQHNTLGMSNASDIRNMVLQFLGTTGLYHSLHPQMHKRYDIFTYGTTRRRRTDSPTTDGKS